MGSKRTLILIAAVAVGALAAFAIYTYVNGIEDRAYNNADRVVVYVVAQDFPQGTTGDVVNQQRLIVPKKMPLEFRPESALTDLSVISGKVAKTNMTRGEVIVSGDFVDQLDAIAGSRVDQLKAGETTVTVSLDQVSTVGGMLQPGDKVSMMVVLDKATMAAETGSASADSSGASATMGGGATDPAATATGIETRFLYQNVEIMAIGTFAKGQTDASGQVPSSGVITFKVSFDAAARILTASRAGSIYLTLEPRNWTPEDFTPVDVATLFTDKSLTPEPKAKP